MSYYDPDNLPFGVSPTDAAGMGINPWDSRSDAAAKFNTDLVRQGVEASAEFWRQQDSASQSSTPTGIPAGNLGAGTVPGAQARLTRQFSFKITNTKDLAATIEDKRRRLAWKRLEETRGLKRNALLSWTIAAILFFMVLFHIQFFNATYRQVTYEYFIVRVGLLAALFSGWTFTRKVARAFTAEEKSWSLLLQALRPSLDRSGAKDWIGAMPRESLTPRLIHDFNEHYKKATGKDIPYVVYQYTALFDQMLCLVPDASTLNAVDMQHGKIVPLEKVGELNLPGA